MCWMCVILLLATTLSLARSAETSTSDAASSQDGSATAGSGESGSNEKNLLPLKLGVWMALVGGVVVIAVVICVSCAIYKIKKNRQSRSSPTYLGSCRRINTIYRSVNVGVQAMKRAGVHPLQHHPHPVPHSRECHHKQEEGGHFTAECLPAQTVTLAPTGVVAAVGVGLNHERIGTVCEGRGGVQDGVCESYRDSLPLGSLSRTYTYPYLHTGREWSHYVHEEETEHHIMTAASAPCLHTLSSGPLPVQEQRESTCQPPAVEADHAMAYMKLNHHTMEGSSDYEKLTKTKPATAVRAGLQGSVVATNLAHGRTKRPPPLITSRGQKVVHAAVREQKSASSSDRGSVEEMGNGTSTELLLQDSAAS